MAEYINRAVALSMREPPKSDRRYQTDNLDDAYGQGWDAALCCLEKLPIADVTPVVHRRWIATHDEFCSCSLCKYPVHAAWSQTNYCPNCGRRWTEV